MDLPSRHRLDVRLAVGTTLALACLALARCGEAQSAEYPTRPVRVFVPYGPGDVGDLTVRLLAQALSDSLKQPGRARPDLRSK